MAPPPTCDSAVSPCFHGCLAFLHHYLLPCIPSISLSAVNSSTRPGIAPHSPNSSSQLLWLPGDPVGGMYGCCKDCLILIPFRLPQISCFIPSLKCFSSDPDSCPDVGMGLLPQFPHPPRAGPVLLTLLFSPWFFHPPEFCVGLYILFHWSDPPVHSQLVLCMHVCVWRCIPDVPVERDVLHVHLLLHLVLPLPAPHRSFFILIPHS